MARQENAKVRGPKDPERLRDRFSLDFAAVRDIQVERSQARITPAARTTSAPVKGASRRSSARRTTARRAAAGRRLEAPAADVPDEQNPALLRLKALAERDSGPAFVAPVDLAKPNWTPLGPLAVPGGQTYGGARVLISGRVTAIAPHPADADTIYIGTSRGGVWRTSDQGTTWTPLGDDQPSLAIGALAIGENDPQVLYAGTGEGNVQYYSTSFPLSSAPGIYLGVGILRSTDGGGTWAATGGNLFSNHSFYRIAVDPVNADRAFAASSRGLCRTTDGTTWTALAGGGLPPIDQTTIACTDVLVDTGDPSGNTVFAAFWGQGIYRSTNALAAAPTFVRLTVGLPSDASRISLKQSRSNPGRTYALYAGSGDTFEGVYRTTSAIGTSWETVTTDATIELYGAFTSDVNVDISTPDVVYVSGVELYRCVRNPATNSWSVTNVGSGIHPDNHTFASHPTLNQTIYAGNDGGFFISRDGGTTWDDSPNEGLCLMQYEAIDNHPSSDAVLQCGTQDNGTQQYRNSPVHYHSADGDGGYPVISKLDGTRMTHAYFGNQVEASAAAGDFNSWTPITAGLDGNGLFYPPAAISPTSDRMAWATDVINVDDAMGSGGWPGSGIALPGLNGAVSAVTFANASTIYCASTSGQVYRLRKTGSTWAVRSLAAAPLPAGQWIWDIQSLPGNDDVVLVAFSGFGLAQHVWKGTIPATGPATGPATWSAVSTGLPDVPMYALALATATTWFVGTDIGVYRTTNAGTAWVNYTQGLPNTAVYDLRLRGGGTLLRAATHGRGLWEIRTDVTAQPPVDLYVRDHVMDDGRTPGVATAKAGWDDPTRHLSLNTPCFWWECADIKTDAPPAFQLTAAQTNYLGFETTLVHESPEKGKRNKVYVQVHNRGPLPASEVTVKVMVAGASAGLPDLPADFWTAWPNSAGDAHWTAVGTPQTVPALDPLRPTVVEWDWTPAASAEAHTCMLVVIDSPSDPIPAAAKVFDVARLVTGDKHVGLKNLQVVNVLSTVYIPIRLQLHAPAGSTSRYLLRLPGFDHPDLQLRILFPKAASKRLQTSPVKGLTSSRFPASDLARVQRHWIEEELHSEKSWVQLLKTYDTTLQYRVNRRSTDVDVPLRLKAGAKDEILLLARRPKTVTSQEPGRFTVQQVTATGELAGGSTFVFRPTPG